MFWENEVFRTANASTWSCSAVISRCCVISLEQATQGRPCAAVWDSSTPLFICQSRYLPELGAVPFAPIQRWTPLDSTLIDYFPLPRSPAHCSSPFLRGLSGSGGLLPVEGPSMGRLPSRQCVRSACASDARRSDGRSPLLPPTPNTPSLAQFEPLSRPTSRSGPPVQQPRPQPVASTSYSQIPTLDWPTRDNIHSLRDASLPPLPDNPHFMQPEKPPYSYASLIAQVIWNAPGQRARLEQIYEYIRISYPFYTTCDAGWQNMLRHNLSLRPVFVKRAKESKTGKGSDWTLDLSLEPLGFDGLQFATRRGKRSKAKAKAPKAAGKRPKAAPMSDEYQE